ncbi:PqqD family protein [Rothia nasimurium]|uniref:PqqD family protein n=1 Tax=Rothia nasimurium TaxID=85336 RepID=UPI001F43C8DB|nr:PqqD family protein [Rothia nasimurium]
MSTLYRRAPHVAFVLSFEHDAIADNASYVANLNTSEIAVLNGPSAVIWEILEEATTTEAIIAEITDIYGVPRETVAESVFSFLDSLEQQGLIFAEENTPL